MPCSATSISAVLKGTSITAVCSSMNASCHHRLCSAAASTPFHDCRVSCTTSSPSGHPSVHSIRSANSLSGSLFLGMESTNALGCKTGIVTFCKRCKKRESGAHSFLANSSPSSSRSLVAKLDLDFETKLAKHDEMHGVNSAQHLHLISSNGGSNSAARAKAATRDSSNSDTEVDISENDESLTKTTKNHHHHHHANKYPHPHPSANPRSSSSTPLDSNGAAASGTSSENKKSTQSSSMSANGAASGNKKGSSSKAVNMSGASSVSSGIRLENVAKTFKDNALLRDVTWEVKKGERVGLVGVNGAGKTTQLKIITGELEPDAGLLLKARPNMKIAYLTQEFETVPTRTVKEEFLNAFEEQMNVKERLENVQRELENATDDMELMSRLLDELDALQQQAENVDLYDVDVKVNKMLPELGFLPSDLERLVASFSGGWQMRISLGKILLQDPDLLLMDEPTNHLDLDTIQWLEQYLNKQDVPMVIVSHDRAFLDQLCTKIIETDMGVCRTFPGNYSDYVQQKAEWVESQRIMYERQQKEIARTEEMVRRLSGGGNTGRASSAEKALERLQDVDNLVEKPFEQKSIRFKFPEMERSGRTVVQISNLSHAYDEKVLFNNAKLLIERGEKVAFVGPNGCGKSTLLRMIMGREEPNRGGGVYLGEHRVVPNYFEQNQAEALDLEMTVLETLESSAEGWKMSDIKALLGRSSFKGESVHRKVKFLSGGEKARLSLCKFMVTPATLLLLDEPTNHLDIPSKEILEEALREFQGTVIAVSHDRYFLRQIVNRVVELKDAKLQDYSGDYNYYLEQNLEARRKELEREMEMEAAQPKVTAKSKMTKAQKELQKKQKAQAFQSKNQQAKVSKNAKRWG